MYSEGVGWVVCLLSDPFVTISLEIGLYPCTGLCSSNMLYPSALTVIGNVHIDPPTTREEPCPTVRYRVLCQATDNSAYPGAFLPCEKGCQNNVFFRHIFPYSASIVYYVK